MAEMTNLTELSRRVNEAEGPSRYLDAEVMLFVRPELAKKPYAQNRIGNWLRMDGRSEIVPAPSFTASLDAVVALIAEKLPEGGWKVCKDPTLEKMSPRAWVWFDRDGLLSQKFRSAKTPALALLSATILAIHERNKTDE